VRRDSDSDPQNQLVSDAMASQDQDAGVGISQVAHRVRPPWPADGDYRSLEALPQGQIYPRTHGGAIRGPQTEAEAGPVHVPNLTAVRMDKAELGWVEYHRWLLRGGGQS